MVRVRVRVMALQATQAYPTAPCTATGRTAEGQGMRGAESRRLMGAEALLGGHLTSSHVNIDE